MKGILFALTMMVGLAGRLHAQPVFTLLDTINTSYQQIGEINSSVFAGIQNTNRLELRRHAGNDLGRVISTVFAGGPLSYFQHMEVAGNYLYLAGLSLQPVNVTNPALPLLGAEIPTDFATGLAHWTDLLYVIHEDNSRNRVQIHSLTNPMRPALVDSFILPGNGVLKVWQNKGYYMYSDTLSGNRILTYSLSNTAPYFTLDNTLILDTRRQPDYPLLDIVSDYLFAKTNDTVYRFHLMSGGMLHLLSKNVLRDMPNSLVAKDSATLYYRMSHQVRALFLSSNTSVTIDTINVMSFNSFQHMGRLGNNLYYSDYLGAKLVGLRSTGIAGIAAPGDDRFTAYPNPVITQWTVAARTDGTLRLYAADGRLLQSVLLTANDEINIPLAALPAGNYHYTITAKDGLLSGGALLKQ